MVTIIGLMLVDGKWRAEPQPMPIQVALQGTGGSIVLIRVEDGSYIYQGTVVSSGDVISVGDARYRLTLLSGGAWQAVFTHGPARDAAGSAGSEQAADERLPRKLCRRQPPPAFDRRR